MRISGLTRRSGVSVGTIKYCRREGLLPEVRALNPAAAEYGEEHVQRLRRSAPSSGAADCPSPARAKCSMPSTVRWTRSRPWASSTTHC